ncbi:MAG: SDR family oxidoreductase [Burkholderiales bacterium]
MHRLFEAPRPGGRVLITGGTGYLGALAAAQLLADGWADHLVLPTRKAPADGGVPEELAREWAALGQPADALAARVSTVAWAGAEAQTEASLETLMRAHGVKVLLHCAGCLDYFDEAALLAVNVEFTRRLTSAAKAAGVRLVVFVSTAYAAGYSGAPVPERPLDEPATDPTAYTRTKREAERVVAACGVPFLVLRPSIVVGDSRDGRYSGKRYGLYQQWMGIERLLTDRYHDELHTVATEQPLNLLHQDAFQAALSGALRWLPDGAHANLVADADASPSMQALWRLFCDVTRPKAVVFYRALDDVDLKSLNVRQRAYLSFAQTNLQIGAYGWRFETRWLEALRAQGCAVPATSLASIHICQQRFVTASPALQRYLQTFKDQLAPQVQYRQAPSRSFTSEAA